MISALRGGGIRALARLGAPSRGPLMSKAAVPAMQQNPLVTPFTKRGYRHWWRTLPEDFELPAESAPADLKGLMKGNPDHMSFIDSYWYWRVRSESTILDPENLPKKSYKQLCRDMGLSIVNQPAEHMMGVIELYEYLKSSPFVGPFGTIENPVLVPSIHTERVAGCTGGPGDSEHVPLWFRCREGFLYRCGECDQIFMGVRVMYELPDGGEIDPIDPDVNDTFDLKLLDAGNAMWNSGEMTLWPLGYDAEHGTVHGGNPRTELLPHAQDDAVKGLSMFSSKVS